MSLGNVNLAIVSSSIFYYFTPDVAIVDPDLVMGLPAKQVAYTGMDALAHGNYPVGFKIAHSFCALHYGLNGWIGLNAFKKFYYFHKNINSQSFLL